MQEIYSVLTVSNLLFCFAGVTLGTLVGVLPGLGPLAAISILLPLSYDIGSPLASIIFLSGIYYGTQYGGSTTAILLKLPGEASSLMTMVDGHQLTQQGRGGAALTIAALSSFFAGTVATVLILVLALPLSEIALKFGPTEYAALMFAGLVAASIVSSDSALKGLSMTFLGVLLGLIGTDVNSGVIRLSGGIPELSDGINFGVLAIGVFGLSEIVWNIIYKTDAGRPDMISANKLYPTKQELKKSAWPSIRGTTVGSILGILPGGGATISSFFSYALEKKISRDPSKFGKGAIEGVAAPEAANNAAAQTGFIPLLSLGIPTNGVMALIISVLIMNGIQPGPAVIENNPELFWGLIVSMWVGNAMLLILNIPLVGVWIRVLQLPRLFLFGTVFLTCIYATYTINNNWFDVGMLIPFTLIGVALKWLDFDSAPLALGFIVGPMLEEFLRRALIISRGDWAVFVHSPISATFLCLIAIIAIIKLYQTLKIHEQNKTMDKI